ncbi:hypothetical protein HHI36_020216 [Cryptolaemus montrouzieri]|uniref:Oligopeptide transporter 1 n=1 Tax=Cryptolaemus montrouzieri TaxID=559131 RepID=A0ABD2NBB1_9CUCU
MLILAQNIEPVQEIYYVITQYSFDYFRDYTEKRDRPIIVGHTDDEVSKTRKSSDDEESQEKKLKYPYSVFFIIGNEFCERFCFYGMRSILTLYLVKILLFSQTDATVTYHAFTMMVYFFPLIGGIISDSYLGKFRTIFYVSIIYAAGSIILSTASIQHLHLPMTEFSIIGLCLIAVGTGGIKPCVSAFGGDQFVLPQQAKLLAMFFSVFYFSINAGSLLSTFLTPILREDVQCFGKTSCFPLAFGVPGILMIVSVVIFGLGRPLYTVKKPEGNIVLKVMKCIGNALKTKANSKEKKEHWLDHSSKKYGQLFVEDVKATLNVLVLYTPLPMFWALYDQQGTAWTFQAVRMDGDIGFYTILPDQFQVVNPLLIMAFIPIFQYGIYPAFGKIGLFKSPLERMTWGGFLAAVAFAVSAFVSMKIEATDPIMPSEGYTQIRFYNPLPCEVRILEMSPYNIKELNDTIPRMGYVEIRDLKLKNIDGDTVEIKYAAKCVQDDQTLQTTLSVKSKDTLLVYFNNDGLNYTEDDVTKDDDAGSPFLRTLTNISPGEEVFSISFLSDAHDLTTINNTDIDRLKMSNGKYQVLISNNLSNDTTNSTSPSKEINNLQDSLEINLRLGGVYTLMLEVNENNQIVDSKLITVTEPNTISMLWLLPQYFIITAAEILFSITGLEFSYSQAPVSMKSVLSAAFLLTDSVGNLFVVIIEAIQIFDKASSEFFLYTGLMVIDMLLFWFLASRYRYVDFEENDKKFKLDEDNITSPQYEIGLDNPVFNKNEET